MGKGREGGEGDGNLAGGLYINKMLAVSIVANENFQQFQELQMIVISGGL